MIYKRNKTSVGDVMDLQAPLNKTYFLVIGTVRILFGTLLMFCSFLCLVLLYNSLYDSLYCTYSCSVVRYF